MDASIANALRRIMLAEVSEFRLLTSGSEDRVLTYHYNAALLQFKRSNVFYYFVKVPTVAIESVWIAVNNSIIQDEVLSHRVGKLIRIIFGLLYTSDATIIATSMVLEGLVDTKSMNRTSFASE